MHASSSNDLKKLEKSLGYTFNKLSILKEAITHKSYAHEKKQGVSSYNERMEFLGDAVLELIISEYLFSTYTEYTEADLSKIKAYIVQESSLAETAIKLKIGSYLLLGKGEEMTGGREKPSLLADAFEAILSAIYIDGGLEKAREFILDNLSNKAEKLAANKFIFDFKTELQEVVQAEFGVLPKYITHNEKGPEHKKVFEVQVYIKDEFFGSGKGRTKKAAAQQAAEAALVKIKESNETNL
jgi:ribonuclease-3